VKIFLGGKERGRVDGVVPDCRRSASVVGRWKGFLRYWTPSRLEEILAAGGSGPGPAGAANSGGSSGVGRLVLLKESAADHVLTRKDQTRHEAEKKSLAKEQKN